jgi:protein involved in polysaccharide export with SLBB domain
MLAFMAGALFTGCASAPSYAFPQAQSTNAEPDAATAPVSVPAFGKGAKGLNPTPDLIQPGVKLTVIFSGISNPPPKHEEKVREDGNISPPLLGRPVMAAGKTIGQLQDELQNLYVPGFYARALTVTVAIEERWIYVGGEVKNPNRFLYSGQMTLLKAIQTAGDFTEFANRRKVQITRVGGRKETVNCVKAIRDPRLDPPIYPSDQIFVPRRLF